MLQAKASLSDNTADATSFEGVTATCARLRAEHLPVVGAVVVDLRRPRVVHGDVVAFGRPLRAAYTNRRHDFSWIRVSDMLCNDIGDDSWG